MVATGRALPRGRLRAAAVLVLAWAGLAEAADWPQFRGPRRDGVSEETGLGTRWPDGGPAVLWRTELGNGYSGLSVYKGRLFTMYGRGDGEYVGCFEATTGSKIWEQRIGRNWRDRMGNGPRATPTVEGGLVYVAGAGGELRALNAGDGETVWRHDLTREYRAEPPTWGISSSPLVENDLLLVDVGGGGGSGVVAFHKRTGKEAWRALGDAAGYAAPAAITVDGVRQVLFFMSRNLVALAPRTGEELWRVAWKTSYDVNAATPVFIPPDRVFVSSGYDVGGAVLEIEVGEGGVAVREVWKNREMKNQFSTSVLHDGYLYGFDDRTLKCVSAETGEPRWRARGFGHGSLTYVDGHFIVLGDRGVLALVEATPEEFREKARATIFTGKTWTVPTFVAGRLFVRDERELVALDLGAREE